MIYITQNENRSSIPSIFQRMNKPFEYRNLLVGDYAAGEFSIDNILDGVILERKTPEDYISSLISGHLSTQLYELSYNFQLSYLFIIGDLRTEAIKRNIPWNTILSSLMGSSFKRAPDGVSGIVVPRIVDNDWDFVTSLILLEEKWSKGETERIPSIVKKSWSQADYVKHIVSSFPNIGEVTAQSLIAKFGSIQGVANASIEELMEVDNIGHKRAQSLYNLCRSIQIDDKINSTNV